MRLLLVRHGESLWNAERRLQGQADVALSDLGRAQASHAAPVITSFAPGRAITSDLSRARETAAILGFPNARLEPALREHSVGNWEGRIIPDIVAETPEAYEGWRAGTFTPSGGEPWADFTARVTAVIRTEQIVGDCRNLLIVCHGGVIRALLNGLLELSPKSVIPVAPASLTTLRLGRDGCSPKLELFNYRAGQIELDAPD